MSNLTIGKAILLLAALAVVSLATTVYLQSDGATQPTAAQAGGVDARVLLRDASGNPVGVAKLTEDDGEVLVRATVHDLPAGFHGFHVHANGECVAPFTSAGGHFNPTAATHPSHAADMPVLLVNSDGTGEARFKTDRYDVADLFDANGSALVIHAKPDNYANIPTDRYDPDPDATTLATGDAGGRIACGVVEGD